MKPLSIPPLVAFSAALWLAGGSVCSGDAVLPADEPRSWEHEPSPYVVPQGLVKGAAFIDRILPMPTGPGGLRSDVWGGENVKPRNVDNGIEDPKWSFWCRSVLKDQSDGKYHLIGARWPENDPKGFDGWSRSRVYHAVSDSPVGPFKVVQEDLGHGHNVTCYRAKDGSYVIGIIYGAYRGNSLNGPWSEFKMPFDFRGAHCPDDSNNTYVSRPDGSVLMVNQPGRVWISEDGLKPFRQVTTSHGAHPFTLGIFEDPIIWRDEVQYNVIFNDWYGRTAYYLRSKDGVKWVWDQGMAYDAAAAKHPDGSRERWYKYERPSVLVDDIGRATHLYLAVLDTRKDLDKPNDGHTCKNIALPLVVQKRLEILSPYAPGDGPTTMRVRIKAEPGFRPGDEVDPATLTFGAPASVDFGKGMKASASARDGDDLIVTFSGGSAGFTRDEFVGKLLGRDRKGGLLFGFARLPGVSFSDPMLDGGAPVYRDGKAVFTVENFGMVGSRPGSLTLDLRKSGSAATTRKAALPAIPAYGKAAAEIVFDPTSLRAGEAATATFTVNGGGEPFVFQETFQRVGAAPASNIPLPAPPGEAAGLVELADSAKRRSFPTGFTVRGPVTHTWLLDGAFRWASFNIGAAKGVLAASTVEVWADGKRIFASNLLRPKSIYAENHFVVVPVQGVRQLSVVCRPFFVRTAASVGCGHVGFGEPKLYTTAEKPVR